MSFAKYLTEDARNASREFQKQKLPSPSLILTSPPYFDLKDYGGVSNQIGLGQKYQEYLYDVVSVLQQCYKISTKDASLWVIIDSFRKNGEITLLPYDLIDKLKQVYGKDTWQLRDVVIWYKLKNTPWHTDGRFRNHFEYILFFTKADKFYFDINSTRETKHYKKWWLTYPERYNSNGRPITNVWEHTTPIRGWGHSRQNHMCSLPFGLLERIIEIGSRKKDIIFDPFGGSGSAIALASCMGRDGIAFDVNPTYKQLFTSEVLLAAKDYWSKRRREKEDAKRANKKFRLQNIALRKLKSTFLLISALDKRVNVKTILTTPNHISNSVCVVLEIPKRSTVRIINQIKIEKPKIERAMKTVIQVKVFTPLGFQKKIRSRKKWFVYDFQKFYKQTSIGDGSTACGTEGIISNINFAVSPERSNGRKSKLGG